MQFLKILNDIQNMIYKYFEYNVNIDENNIDIDINNEINIISEIPVNTDTNIEKVKTDITNINSIKILEIYFKLNYSNLNINIQNIPMEILDLIEYKKGDCSLNIKIITSYIKSKIFYTRIFNNCSNIHDFFVEYEKNINEKGYNIYIKLFNNKDSVYLKITKENLIKIKYAQEITKIIDIFLYDNNTFIIKKENEYYINYGKIIKSDIDRNDIIKYFLNNDVNNNHNYFMNFTNIIIVFWCSSKIT